MIPSWSPFLRSAPLFWLQKAAKGLPHVVFTATLPRHAAVHWSASKPGDTWQAVKCLPQQTELVQLSIMLETYLLSGYMLCTLCMHAWASGACACSAAKAFPAHAETLLYVWQRMCIHCVWSLS